MGFIHNVSPLNKGNLFDSRLQLKEKTVRGVCFSPEKRKLLSEFSNSGSPVKIKKFEIERSWNAEDLILRDETCVEQLQPDEIDFLKTDMPITITVSMIKKLLCVGQLVTVKAKAIHLSQPNEIQVNKSKLTMVEGTIADPTGNIRLIIWEDLIPKIQQGCTYIFKKIRIKKDMHKQEIYVNTAKRGSKTIPTENFTEILPTAPDMPHVYTNTTVVGTIIGVERINCYLSCCKCSKKVDLKPSSNVASCTAFHLKQKKSSCAKQYFAHILFANGDRKVSLTLFHGENEQPDDIPTDNQLSEDVITEILLDFDKVNVTFNNTTKVVSKLAISP